MKQTHDIHRMLDIDGQIKQSPTWLTEALALTLYRGIHLTRLFDQKAVYLQRTGQLGTFPSSLGQEAVFVTAGLAMQHDDRYCPYYRDQGALLQRNVRASELLAVWGGDEVGHAYQNNPFDLPLCVPIATQCTIAAGIAYAMMLQAQRTIVVCTLGDGATSKGDFYEALNFASIYQLPLVFLVNNNRLAISVPLEKQMAEKRITQRGLSVGIQSFCVDGHDPFALYEVYQTAFGLCRSEQGPVLIEAQTHRLCDHTTADDASRYLPDGYLQEGQKLDALLRLGRFIDHHYEDGLTKREDIENNNNLLMEKEIDAYQALPPPQKIDMFKHMYATMPLCLQQQYQMLKELNL